MNLTITDAVSVWCYCLRQIFSHFADQDNLNRNQTPANVDKNASCNQTETHHKNGGNNDVDMIEIASTDKDSQEKSCSVGIYTNLVSIYTIISDGSTPLMLAMRQTPIIEFGGCRIRCIYTTVEACCKLLFIRMRNTMFGVSLSDEWRDDTHALR